MRGGSGKDCQSREGSPTSGGRRALARPLCETSIPCHRALPRAVPPAGAQMLIPLHEPHTLSTRLEPKHRKLRYVPTWRWHSVAIWGLSRTHAGMSPVSHARPASFTSPQALKQAAGGEQMPAALQHSFRHAAPPLSRLAGRSSMPGEGRGASPYRQGAPLRVLLLPWPSAACCSWNVF